MVHATTTRLAGALLALTLGAGAEPAPQFTADLVISRGGDVRHGTLHVRGDRYRLELPQPNGPDVVLLVDPGTDLTRVLVPRYRVYFETKTSSGPARMYDPFAGMRRAVTRYETEVEGEEERAGRTCRRELVHYEGQPVLTRWVAADLGWPVRVEMARPRDTWVRLDDVTERPVEAALLEVPADWEAVEPQALHERVAADEEMQAKAAEWERTRPREERAQQTLSPGSEARLLLGDDVAVAAEVRYAAEKPLRWSVVPLRDGEPLRPAGDCVFDGPADATWLPALRPDTIVVRGLQGRAHLALTLRGRPPLLRATSEVYEQAASGGRSWRPSLASWKLVRVTFRATQESGVAEGTFRVKRGEEKEEHALSLEPGASLALEWSADDGPTPSFDLMLRSGTLRVEVVEDTRDAADRNP